MLEDILPDWEKRIQERGEQIGQERGEQIGQERGEKIGEKNKANERAKNLVNIGLTVEQIIQATGLSKKNIMSLKNQNANA